MTTKIKRSWKLSFHFDSPDILSPTAVQDALVILVVTLVTLFTDLATAVAVGMVRC